MAKPSHAREHLIRNNKKVCFGKKDFQKQKHGESWRGFGNDEKDGWRYKGYLRYRKWLTGGYLVKDRTDPIWERLETYTSGQSWVNALRDPRYSWEKTLG